MVLYRKYRPQKLSDLIGQEHVVKTLLAQLESGKIAHGYLFAGPRGTGKTSTARILAKAINCESYKSSDKSAKFGEPCNKCAACKSITDGSYLDLIEIDAASNRGIDEIRDLREKIKLSPVAGRFKVYIIDEVHMLTTEAFNALLKTLEEPPAHAIFILCTTEPNKLPQTIISRLLRFDFKRATNKDLQDAVSKICKAEKLSATDSAIDAVVRAADGSYRDALSVLEQIAAFGGKIEEQDVKAVLKTSGYESLCEFAALLIERDIVAISKKLDDFGGNVDLMVFNRDLLLFFEKVLQFKIGVFSQDEVDSKVKEIAERVEFQPLQNLMRLLLVTEGEMKLYPLPQISLLLAYLKWCGEPAASEALKVKVGNEQLEDKSKAEVKGVEVKEKVKEIKPRKDYKAGKVSLEDVEKSWGEFLARIRPVNAHVVALLKSTRPTSVEGDTLNLEVFFRFHKDKLEEPKIMDLMCDTLSELLDSKVVLKMQLAQRFTKPPVVVSKSNVAEPTGEDLSKLAEEIFLK